MPHEDDRMRFRAAMRNSVVVHVRRYRTVQCAWHAHFCPRSDLRCVTLIVVVKLYRCLTGSGSRKPAAAPRAQTPVRSASGVAQCPEAQSRQHTAVYPVPGDPGDTHSAPLMTSSRPVSLA
eukprot:4836695-Prymnesium_polylepis.3